MLANKPLDTRCVCGDIVHALPLAQSTVSQHLKVLKETGWVQGEIDGPRVCYCIVEGIMQYYMTLMKRFIGGIMRNVEIIDIEEEIMFTVSEKAREMVKEFFKHRQELSPVRIVKTSG
jgi:DNA-binding transcriptional ArsR family regulator